VDVPGHERFVANMLAGVGPVPAVLFVVAAEEGWMPQSAEHLLALHALGVEHGLLAVTKTDLMEPDLAAEEALEHIRATSLGDIPWLGVSARTGSGLPELRTALDDLVSRLPPSDPAAPVRLWVDRAFTIRGAGLVVTGTLPAGTVQTRPGAIMGAADKFRIRLTGKGGHAGVPHDTPDTLLAAASLVQQLNTVVARAVPASAAAVLSVTEIHGGHAHNVIPAEAMVGGTVRSFDPAVQDRIEQRMRQILAGIAASFEVGAELDYDRYYPATINDPKAAADALEVAATVATASLAPEPAATSEDFSFMLQHRPGAYIWLGQGSPEKTAPLHNPGYDFNDSIMETGVKLHVALARHWLA